MITSERYIVLLLFSLLVILVCSGHNIPTIASGTYGSGWKHDSNGNIKADPSRGVTSVIYNARNLPEQVEFSDGSRLYGYYMGDGEYAGSREREKIITTVDGGTGTKATYLTTTRKQFGNFVETNSTLSRVYIDEGYIDVSGGAAGSEYHYYVKDWQGSVRAIIDEEGELKQTVDYSAYGVPSTRYGMTEDNRLHLGLEWQSMKGWNSYQNNARTRDPLYARFQQQDPMADKYYPFSPYHYGACNPLLNLDFNGMDWYSYNTITYLENGETINKTEYAYTDYTSQEALTNAGINGTYLGKVVVVFNGSIKEKLGEGQNLYGKGAVLADVTVYGPNGEDDVKNYQGFTMTSDYQKFGAIDNGVYNVSYVSPGKSGALSSNYVLNNGGPVNCLNGENRSPKEYFPYSSTQKNGIYIHRSNNNGWAGDNYVRRTAVSTGCLLILPKDWNKFCNQIGKNNFTLILNRK